MALMAAKWACTRSASGCVRRFVLPHCSVCPWTTTAGYRVSMSTSTNDSGSSQGDSHGGLGASVSTAEVNKFTSQAAEWWDPTSKTFGPLHSLNAVRVPFICQAIHAADTTGSSPLRGARALAGVSVLDAGCGGGVLAESLARIGACVTGIDPGHANIEAAQAHAARDSRLAGRLTYHQTTVEELAASGAKFDAVISSEVLEHVSDVPGFIQSCADLVQPGGAVIFTTLNRTVAAHVSAITLAERVFGLLPNGTHEWAKFITPKELDQHARAAGLRPTDVTGFRYNPVVNRWWTSSDTSVNYALAAVKPSRE